jgi:hypothetical protein
MVAVSDITAAKADCIAKINAMISAARELQKTATDADRLKLEDAINELKKLREEIRVQEYVAALNSAAMQNALATINSAATNMNTVAQNMKTVTQIIANLAAFLGAASQVLPALTGQA